MTAYMEVLQADLSNKNELNEELENRLQTASEQLQCMHQQALKVGGWWVGGG